MAKQKEQPKSAVIELLDLVYGNANRKTGHSWERLNHAMRDALALAIGSGFEFAEGDVAYIMGHYKSGCWIGETDEWVYADAINVGNMSAIHSYERYKGREPFFGTNVRFRGDNTYLHLSSTRKKERLAVGVEFEWHGKKHRVTSFAADNTYVNACSYKRIKRDGKWGGYDEKIDKRIRIGRDGLKANLKEIAERRALYTRISQAVYEDPSRFMKVLPKTLGPQNEWDSVAIAKIRAFADEYAPPPAEGTYVTAEMHKQARAAGFCSEAAKRYPVGTLIARISDDDWRDIEYRLHDLAEKYKHLRKSNAQPGSIDRGVQVAAG